MKIIMYPSPPRHVINPFIHVLAAGLKAAGVRVLPISAGGVWFPRILHVHWLEQVFWGRFAQRISAVAYLRALHLIHVASGVRRRGGRVVWTIHNLAPHEAPVGIRQATWKRLAQHLLPLVTDVVLMSNNTLESVVKAYPISGKTRFHVIPHPSFREFCAER